MINKIVNNYVWDMSEENWNGFRNKQKQSGVFLGYCRIGDLCFDLRTWDVAYGSDGGWGYELFCGGVDSGYGYSATDALKTGKYEDKYNVPDEALYPYDVVDDGYGDFPEGFENMPYDEFKKKAELIFSEAICSAASTYKLANLIDKANEPLHEW